MQNDNLNNTLNDYYPLVKHIAKSACYSSNVIDIDDLCQVGEMAVLRAIRAYDPSNGANIKSFVTKSIRTAIYNEAARFIGVVTVDHYLTALASKVDKLSQGGKTDLEIADILSRHLDENHVRDLRISYNRRRYSDVYQNETASIDVSELTIQSIFDEATSTDLDKSILKNRILGNRTVDDLAKELNISKREVSCCEEKLKNRILLAIEERV